MSGGSLEYVYFKVEEAAESLSEGTPHQRLFSKHLLLVAEALHASEWVLSGDWSGGDDEKYINEVLRDADRRVCESELDEIRSAVNSIAAILNREL